VDAQAFRKVLEVFCIPPAKQGVSSGSLRTILGAIQDETVRVHDLQPLIEANPVYRDSLLKLDLLSKRITEWNAEVPEHGLDESILLNRSLGLLGKQATRNAIFSIGIQRSAGTPFPKKGPKQNGPKDSLKINPREQLLYALTSEEYCQENHFVSSDHAFMAGLHYDWIAARAIQQKLPPEIKTSLAEAHKEGLLIARCAYQVAGKLKTVPHGKSIFAAGLLIPIGKVLMGFTYPRSHTTPYAVWIADFKKTQGGALEWDYFEYQERRRFVLSHLELSAVLTSFFGHLAPIELAIAYAREPYALKLTKPDLYTVSMILSLGRAIAALVGGLKTPRERVVTPSHLQWLTENRIPHEALQEIQDLVKSGKDLGANKVKEGVA